MRWLLLIGLGAGGCGDVVIAFDTETDASASVSASTEASSTEVSSSEVPSSEVSSSEPATGTQESTGPPPAALPDYVVTGVDQRIAVSFDDGRTWTEYDPMVTEDVVFEAVAGGPERVIAIGGFDTAVSTDGLSWETFTDSLGYAKGVAYGDGMFVSVGGDRLARSADGEGWIDALDGASVELTGIVHGDGRFVAVGGDQIVSSTDGIAWTTTTLSQAGLGGVAYANGRFLAVGEQTVGPQEYAGRVVATPDGAEILLDEVTGPPLWAVCAFEGEFLAYSPGALLRSETGEEWVNFSAPTAWSLVCGPTSFLLLSDDVIYRGEAVNAVEAVHQTSGAWPRAGRYTGGGRN